MNSAVETLGPTRAKLTVEVPFDELKPALDAAYRKVGQQIRVKGFRPGKVPPRIIDQQVGRAAVLEEAVNEALPGLYGDAVRTNEIDVLGHPEIEITTFEDGNQLVFTAEVDVRPDIELPDYDGLPVSIDDAEVSESDVDEQLQGLRDRFATLAGVDRAAATGDFVSIDLSATIDGATIEDAGATSLSYEVGSDSLVRGLDEAIVGLSAGESMEFETQLRAGEHGGETATATVTVRSVKAKDVPELDDDFAMTASEFDTIEELRADMRGRLERVKLMTQGMQARDKVLEALLGKVEVPIPEHMLADEVAYRREQFDQQLEGAGLTREVYAEAEQTTPEALDEDLAKGSRDAIKTQFVLDALARKEELGVEESELTDAIVRRAQQANVRPDEFAQQVVAQGQLGALMAEVLRGKALALVMDRATVTDASGRPVDLDALMARAEGAPDDADGAADAETDAATETEPAAVETEPAPEPEPEPGATDA
jgi:trigger factor